MTTGPTCVPSRAGLPDEKPPRAAWGMYQRAALAGVLIVLMTAASVATAGLLTIKDEIFTPIKRTPTAKLRKDTITRADAGEAQTILLVGSDRRYGWKRGESRSDTMMLLRLDPDQEAIGALSVPRDLVVDIPGRGRAKVNEAYTFGGVDLTARTLKQILNIDINHVIEVSFKGFRRGVNAVGCVYTDVDRRYYHSNLGLPAKDQYAEIDIQPGYQRLCGQKALDYVRFRHADTDLVRAARQQDFLRQAKDQIGTSGLIDNRGKLTDIFSRSSTVDADLKTDAGILRVLKLAIFSAGHPLSEVEFPHTFVNAGTRNAGGFGDYVTATPEQIAEAVDDFMHARPASKAKSTGAPKKKKKKKTAKGKSAKRKTSPSLAQYDVVDARTRAEDLVAPVLAKSSIDFPVYFPSALTPTGVFVAPTTTPKAPNPRIYTLRDRSGKKHWAYRIVIAHNVTEGQYYGVEGTTWMQPPLLKRDGDKRRMRGRTYRLFYDGKRLRAVSWSTPRAVYWVSNTLSLQLTNKQMLGTARSLTRFGSS
jgi:LCP family protein required for cell wall assembly